MSLDSTQGNINPGSISPGLGNALPLEALLGTVEKDTESMLMLDSLFSSAFLPIARFLDPDALSKLSCTSKTWRDLTRGEELWQMLLERDFGKMVVWEAEGNYRNAYMRNFKSLKEFISKLRGGEQLLEDSRIDALRGTTPHKIGGLLSLSCLDAYINGLSKFELEEMFVRAAEFGFISIVRAISESPRFNEISENKLGEAFLSAVRKDQYDVMQLIMQHPRFGEINTNGRWGLRRAFRNNVCGRIETLRLIRQHPWFDEIDVNAGDGLNGGFVDAAFFGYIEVMQLIMQHPRFGEINVNGQWGLGKAFEGAAKGGYIDAMQLIMQHPRFGEINANGEWGLGRAFEGAAKGGYLDAVKLFMQNPRFVEINGYIDAMKFILQDPLFSELDANEAWGGLEHAFVIAAQMGRIDIIDIIMDDPGFIEIDKSTVISVIKQSSISVGLHILKKWPLAYLTGIFVEDYMSSSLT